MNFKAYRSLGVGIWSVAIIAACFMALTGEPGTVASLRDTVLVATVQSDVLVQADDQTGRHRPGDPIFMRKTSPVSDGPADAFRFGPWKQIGHIGDSPANTGRLSLAWYGDEDASEFDLIGYRQSGRLEDIVATMLPEDKRAQVQLRLQSLVRESGKEIVDSMLPLIQRGMKESMPVIESAFRQSIASHQTDIDDQVERWNQEVVRARLVPLARQRVLPIVRKNAEPEVATIGKELWDRASLWQFGWRAIYDRVTDADYGLVQEEWDRFVDEEAMPVLDSHSDSLVKVIQTTLQEIASDKQVRSELREVAVKLASDEASQKLVREILNDTFVNNQALAQVWREVWSSREARTALDQAADKVEPVLRKIGDDLFGTREKGINPDFARVLRSQILGKDRRWVIAVRRNGEQAARLDPLQSATVVIRPAVDRMPYPIIYTAGSPVKAEAGAQL